MARSGFPLRARWPFLWDGRCRPPLATNPGDGPETGQETLLTPVAPIRSCSRRGLPCLGRCRPSGALLPHPFTLAAPRRTFKSPAARRFAFCGAFPGVAPAGGYPAPCLRGARTFLCDEAAAIRPAGAFRNRRPSGRGQGLGPPTPAERPQYRSGILTFSRGL